MNGSRVLFTTVTALVLAVGAVGCGTDDTSSDESVSSATTSVAEDVETPAESADGDIPIYQPSSLVSQAIGSTVLTSADPIEKISDFYVDAVEKGGWETVSKSVTRYSTNLTVKKSGQGASISIAPSGEGTVISISTYPSF
ncbi:MAG: hypothetical protein WAW17_08630 [Rhodococcus sp. (in: high G+C Gram-positive bacteria)]|uniref:hypothetical protein n=1 Tax=Rhodococcus sp. TaxID=1831 RepID=UPI003BB093A9